MENKITLNADNTQRIFALYLYKNCVNSNGNKHQITFEFLNKNTFNQGVDNISFYSIELKSIANISDEDIEKLTKEYTHSGTAKEAIVKAIAVVVNDEQDSDDLDLPISTTIRVIDGLRKLGYATRYG